MTGSTSFPTLVEGYRVYCLAEGKSPKTIRWYLGKLRIFQEYLAAQGIPLDAAAVTTAHLRAFLVHLREDVRADAQNPLKPARDAPLAAGTIQGYARTLKAFFAWLAREEYLPKDPAQRVGIPKAPDTVVETFSEAQVQRLLGVIDRRGARGFRDYSIVLVLLDTGIRLSELVHLQVGDVDFDRATFKVLGKGARERLVPFGAKVQASLWKYLHKFRPAPFHPSVGEVFLRSDGLPMTGNYVYRLVRGYGEAAGLEGVRCSPHTFRHTFAKNYLLNGGDLFTPQKILGHSSLYVVRLYVNLASEDVQAQHRRYSPVDMMKIRG